MRMPHQQRVIEEREQLVNRLCALTAFFGAAAIEEITACEQSLLLQQARTMLDYLDVLNARIRCFSNTNEE